MRDTAREPRATAAVRENVTVADLILVAFVVLALYLAAAASGSVSTADLSATKTVRVVPGDTLWDVARRHPIQGLETASTVDVIARINDIPGHQLVEGQSIRVPVQADASALAHALINPRHHETARSEMIVTPTSCVVVSATTKM